MINIRNNEKWQEYEVNTTLIIIKIIIENKIAGYQLDSSRMFATMYVTDRYKEQQKVAGI